MIAEKIRFILFICLAGTLVFNLTQRKHLEHGEKKRFASLYIAGLFFILYLYSHIWFYFQLPDFYFLAVIVSVLAVGYVFRDKIFIFHLRCSQCNNALALNRVLYFDSTLCPECEIIQTKGVENIYTDLVSDVDWDRWVPTEKAVLCFVREADKLLLIHKKTGLGAGKINAPGGRIDGNETEMEAAIREVQEEIGVTPINIEKHTELSFIFADGYSLHASVFVTDTFEGTPYETKEADPFWCKIDEIPWERMWEDDQLWLPLMLQGKYVQGYFIFDGDKMLDQKMDVRESKPKNW